MVRRRQHQILEEGLRHVEVVMLTSVDDNWFGPVGFPERMVKRRDFHEVRPDRCDQVDGFQVIAPIVIAKLLSLWVRAKATPNLLHAMILPQSCKYQTH
jgi:hypothetical protein